jgi:DNA polymerase III delta subunit
VEKKKNIILITGKDTTSIEEEISRFEKVFRDKHSPDNIHRHNLGGTPDWRSIEQETQAMGLFVEKRLFIFR